ncbi:hypothetical protein [Paraburkholderia xenovorans]|uniref:hypothetical protein n=1 Tax=Paraburkholderia xenovorans TaxID=36873 RepID=UPI0038995DC5
MAPCRPAAFGHELTGGNRYELLKAVVSCSDRGAHRLPGACAELPTAPSVMALPGTGKTFDQFETDDATCRHFALGQAGGAGANETAANTALGGAAVGTALGAAAGAAFNGGAGAAVGAGAGLLAGSAFGTAAARGSIYNAQRRYDVSGSVRPFAHADFSYA